MVPLRPASGSAPARAPARARGVRRAAVAVLAAVLAALTVLAPPAVAASGGAAVTELAVPGHASAYFVAPSTTRGLAPVIVFLHGRGGEPRRYCERWSRVTRDLGWLLCPSGPEDRGEGKRGWNNGWAPGRRVVMDALAALRERFGRRVQLRGNTLVGFSEGAFVAMNVGLREPRAFDRWLILGADADYWGAEGRSALADVRGKLRRVYLLTGARDQVVTDAEPVRRALRQAGVAVRLSTPADLGHEVALEAKPKLYRAALRWLVKE